MEIISFRFILVLGGLCLVGALICAPLATDRSGKKITKSPAYHLCALLALATLCVAALGILKVGILGVRYVAHEMRYVTHEAQQGLDQAYAEQQKNLAIATKAKAKAEAD
jgi:hypothetical protein